MLKLKITCMLSESCHSCLFENKCKLIIFLYYLRVQVKNILLLEYLKMPINLRVPCFFNLYNIYSRCKVLSFLDEEILDSQIFFLILHKPLPWNSELMSFCKVYCFIVFVWWVAVTNEGVHAVAWESNYYTTLTVASL